MTRSRALVWGAAAALLLPASRCRADVLCLADGRIFEAPPITRTKGGYRIAFEHGEVFVPAELVVDALIESDPGYQPTTDEEREMVAKGLVRYEGHWVSPRRREEMVQKRLDEKRAAIEDLRAHREWRNRYQEDTKSFHFEFTVPRYIYEDYRDKMEAYFQTFCKDWRIHPGKTKLNVCFYADRKEFLRTSGAGPNVLGYFKFVGQYDLNIYYDRLDPDETEDVMFHEANHYLQKLIDEDFSYPHWPGEALAEYYGASEWDPEKKELHTGLVQEGRLVEVLSDIDRGAWIGLQQMITTDQMYEHYTWGWSLVHFLMNDPSLSKRFQKFFLALAHGRDVKRESQGFGSLQTVTPEEVWSAFRSYLGLKSDDDVQELQKRWYAYIQDDLRASSAGGLEKAALEAKREGRTLRAKRLFQEAIEAGTKKASTYHAYADLLLDEGDTPGAIEEWKRAIALDPLTADYYLALGRAQKGTDAKESERLVALAKEIDPEADLSDWWQ